jgi:Phage integrase family
MIHRRRMGYNLNRRRFLMQVGCGSLGASLVSRAWSQPSASATLRLSTPATSRTIPASFTGLSYELAQLTDPAFFSSDNTMLVTLFRLLTPQGLLRLGGNTSEFCWFQAQPSTPAPKLHTPPGNQKLAGHCLIAMAFTTMGFGELRHLRRMDVRLDEAIPVVEVDGGTKNDYRIRVIPLNPIPLASLRWIVKRWEKIGRSEAEQYILPHHATRTPEQRGGKGHRRKSPPNFVEPMGHIYKGARGILKAAGLSDFHPYDMRSHAITKLLSNPKVSDQVCEEIAGHVSKQMLRRYSRQQLETKQAALSAMCTSTFQAQRETSRVIMFPTFGRG